MWSAYSGVTVSQIRLKHMKKPDITLHVYIVHLELFCGMSVLKSNNNVG